MRRIKPEDINKQIHEMCNFNQKSLLVFLKRV